MAKGLKIPVQVNNKGGSLTIEGDEYSEQVLYTGLSGHDNANAFQQDTGLGEGMIFGLSGTSTRASVLRRLRELFDIWEAQRLYRLMNETICWTRDIQRGEEILQFKYVNLETNRVLDFGKRFLSGG